MLRRHTMTTRKRLTIAPSTSFRSLTHIGANCHSGDPGCPPHSRERSNRRILFALHILTSAYFTTGNSGRISSGTVPPVSAPQENFAEVGAQKGSSSHQN